jgi:hypothetical protein
LGAHNMLLTVINLFILVLAVWIVIEGFVRFFSSYGSYTGEPETA